MKPITGIVDCCARAASGHAAAPASRVMRSRRLIAGLGVISVACIATKSERRFGLRFAADPVSKATSCDLNHTCRRDAGLFSLARKAMFDRVGRMLSRFWRWLEYDPVAFAVLLIGVASIAVLVLGI